ncbi:34839_t:CDS:2, partial [Racocetra persica]
AISLTEQIESILLQDKKAKLRQIRTLLAHNLFQQQKFDEAITIFQELETDPAEVISLYPPSISGTLHSGALHQQNLEKSETNHENGLTTVKRKLLEDAVSALIRFLTDRRQKILNSKPKMRSDILSGSSNVNGNTTASRKLQN